MTAVAPPVRDRLLGAAELLGEAGFAGDYTAFLAHVGNMGAAAYWRFYVRFCAADPDVMAALASGEAWAPGGRMVASEAGDRFRQSLDADAARARKTARRIDRRRSDLAKLVFGALRQNRSSALIATQLRAANARLSVPLTATELKSLATWCVEHHQSEKNAGR